MNGHLKDAFWEAVSDSLEEFHGFSPTAARARALHLRLDVERGPQSRFEPDLIYHDEPFYIASRLAGRELDLEPHMPEYQAILTRRFGNLEAYDPHMGVSASHAAASRLVQGGW